MISLQENQVTKLSLFNLKNVSIRTFWIIAMPFFMWFSIVPFVLGVVKDLGLIAQNQNWNSIILAVSGTVFICILIDKVYNK